MSSRSTCATRMPAATKPGRSSPTTCVSVPRSFGMRRMALVLCAVVATAFAAVPVQAAPAVAARVPLPIDRLHFGLGNEPGEQTWFVNSGVPWAYRYTYLAGGINNGGAAGDACGANNGWQSWNS